MLLKDPETHDYFDLEPKHRPRYITAQQITDAVYTTPALHIRTLAMDFKSDVTIKQRKQIEAQWIEVLPQLGNVQALWVRHLAGDNFLEAVCKMKNLQDLWFETSVIENLEAIKNLQQLKKLRIRSSKLTDIRPVVMLKNLEALSVDASFKIRNYEVIGEMKQLKGLKFAGDSFAPKKLKLKSLEAFSLLTGLEHFALETVTVEDKNFDALLDLKNLQRLDITTGLTKTIAQKLKGGLKNLKAGNVYTRNFDSKSDEIIKVGSCEFGEVWTIKPR